MFINFALYNYFYYFYFYKASKFCGCPKFRYLLIRVAALNVVLYFAKGTENEHENMSNFKVANIYFC